MRHRKAPVSSPRPKTGKHIDRWTRVALVKVSWQENGGRSELMTQCVPDLQLDMLDLAINNTSLSPET